MICIGISLTGFLIEKTKKKFVCQHDLMNPNEMHSNFLLAMVKIVANYVLIWHHIILLNILIEREILVCRYKWLHNHFLFDGFFFAFNLVSAVFLFSTDSKYYQKLKPFHLPTFPCFDRKKKKARNEFRC